MNEKYLLFQYFNVLRNHPDYIYKLIYAYLRHPLNAVAIETSSQCNRKCSFCPHFIHHREIAYMDERLFHKIIDELKEIHFSGRLGFTIYNEPLLDKRLPDLVGYASKQLPEVYFYLNTNGDFLDISMWKTMRRAGIDFFVVSQYDGRPNDNIEELLNILEEEEKKHIRLRIFDVAADGTNRGGLVKAGKAIDRPLRRICSKPFFQLNINYKGKAVLCCNDYLGLVEIGDAHHQHVTDIWQSKIFSTYRKKLLLADRASLNLCKTCNNCSTVDCLPTQEQRMLQPLKQKELGLFKNQGSV